MHHETPEFLGPRQLINRHEYIRLLEQSLHRLGFSEAANLLERDSVRFLLNSGSCSQDMQGILHIGDFTWLDKERITHASFCYSKSLCLSGFDPLLASSHAFCTACNIWTFRDVMLRSSSCHAGSTNAARHCHTIPGRHLWWPLGRCSAAASQAHL